MIVKDLNKIRETIEDFAKNIAEEVAHKRYYEVDEIKAIATTRLTLALNELVGMQLLDMESDMVGLVKMYQDPSVPGWKKFKLQGEIAELKLKIKQNNRLKSSFEDYNEYKQLVHYVRDKYGNDVFQDFCDNYRNKEENVLNITKRQPKSK